MEPILFADTAAFETWLAAHHDTTGEVWILKQPRTPRRIRRVT